MSEKQSKTAMITMPDDVKRSYAYDELKRQKFQQINRNYMKESNENIGLKNKIFEIKITGWT